MSSSRRIELTAAMALAGALAGSPARAVIPPPPSLFAEGFGQGSTLMPAQATFHAYQATGPIAPAAMNGNGADDTEGSAGAYVDYGVIGIYAGGRARQPTSPVQGGTIGSGDAFGEFTDQFTIVPPSPALAQHQGTLVFSVPLRGGGTASGVSSGGFYELEVQLDTCPTGLCDFVQQGSWIDRGPSGGGFLFSGDPPTGFSRISVPIEFSRPILLDVRLSADAQALGVSGDFATASAAFGHTLTWGGFDDVMDSEGASVTGYTVTSDSGTDWSKPLPEPSAESLRLAALASLATVRAIAGRRRRCQRTVRLPSQRETCLVYSRYGSPSD